MEWIVALFILLLLGFVIRKSIDPETARGIKRLTKVFAVSAGLLLLLVVVSCLTR